MMRSDKKSPFNLQRDYCYLEDVAPLLLLDGFSMLLVRDCSLDQGTVIVAYGGGPDLSISQSDWTTNRDRTDLAPGELTLFDMH
jgi:hypothetical protein